MKLKFLAHASFLITSNKGTSIIVDPYDSLCFDGAITYDPINEKADILVITHDHADHNYVSSNNEKAALVKKEGSFQFGDVDVVGFKTFHDEVEGKERGENIIFKIVVDEISILHLGDLGHALSSDMVKRLGRIDVLLVPVGGLYTIDANVANEIKKAVNPKICIPMHYKTEKIAIDFDPLDSFMNKVEIQS